jgi:hypothetical protein
MLAYSLWLKLYDIWKKYLDALKTKWIILLETSLFFREQFLVTLLLCNIFQKHLILGTPYVTNTATLKYGVALIRQLNNLCKENIPNDSIN